MKQQRLFEIILIYTTGLIQGLVLVTIPAASSVFTDPQSFGFSESQYGALFIPQVIMSIVAALLVPKLSKRMGSKFVYQGGLFLNVLATSLIGLSQCFVSHQTMAYICVLMATTAVGAAFGTVLPMINVYAQRFFPNNPAGAITGLHTLLGTGTAIAPLLVVVLVKGFGWWIMPFVSFLILLIIFVISFILPLYMQEEEKTAVDGAVKSKFYLPLEFWLFVAVIFLYGYCETIFANWGVIYLKTEKSFSVSHATYALAMFWAMVTMGRLLFSLLSKWVPSKLVYKVLPIMIIVSLWMVTTIHSANTGILFFGFAGLACSAFFPLSFSFAQKRFESMAETVSGALMASYMLGYGFASYGIGKLIEISGVSLISVYRSSIFIAIIVTILGFILRES